MDENFGIEKNEIERNELEKNELEKKEEVNRDFSVERREETASNPYGGYRADGYETVNNPYMADRSYIDAKPAKVKKERKPSKVGKFFGRLVAALLIGVVFGGAAAGSWFLVNKYIIKDDASKIQTEAEIKKLNDSVASLEKEVLSDNAAMNVATSTMVVTDVTGVVDVVMPSMVAVTNRGEEKYQDWFGRVYSQDTESRGSGIIVGESDSEYFIATNHHVINGAKELEVSFVDESTAIAYVKGYEPSMDIAVISVKKSDLQSSTLNTIRVAQLGDSTTLRMGEPAIAIGNALGYGQSVTTGVVSAFGREIEIDGTTYTDLIQTSAAINPGNSGGALLNIEGQVIGINSSKVSSNAVEGVGFAIPIDAVKDIISEFSLREVRSKVDEAKRGFLGIQGTTQDITALGYPDGAYIVSVYAGSPAEAAGLHMGDIIVKCDGQTVKNLATLQDFLTYYAAGDEVTLTVKRNVDGAFVDMEVTVKLGDRSAITE